MRMNKLVFCLVGILFLISFNSVSAFDFAEESGGQNITINQTFIVNASTNHSNSTDYWITNEGALNNVIDIFGSEINNNLNWINSSGIPTSIWNSSGGTIFPSNLSKNVGIGGINADAPLDLSGAVDNNLASFTPLIILDDSQTLIEGGRTFKTGFDMILSGADSVVTYNGIADVPARALMNAGVDGDTFRRFRIEADGTLQWGSGSSTTDVMLERNAVGELTIDGVLKTNERILVSGNTAPADGTGVSIGFSSPNGLINVFDFTTNSYKHLRFNALSFDWEIEGVDKMHMDNDGDLAIGHVNPDEKLHVIGNIMLNDTFKMLFGNAKDVSQRFNATDYITNADVGSPNYFITNFAKIIIDTATDILGDLFVSGNINATGNITSANVFIPQYVFSHTNQTIPVLGASTWTNITFSQEDADIKFGINHIYNDNTNHTFTITEDGVYDIDYNMDVEDTSPSASTIDVAGRVVYFNGTEIQGSVFELDIIKQGMEVELSHNLLAKLSAGDIIIIQFIASNSNVHISTHGTFGDHPNSASIVIEKVANL